MLQAKDAPFMLEWMHDMSVVGALKADFTKKTLADCEAFIREANENYQKAYQKSIGRTL